MRNTNGYRRRSERPRGLLGSGERNTELIGRTCKKSTDLFEMNGDTIMRCWPHNRTGEKPWLIGSEQKSLMGEPLNLIVHFAKEMIVRFFTLTLLRM
tara:strand:- start:235 stop:525 length:291 start_codon:yes stop_codon:yes gene_type:complete